VKLSVRTVDVIKGLDREEFYVTGIWDECRCEYSSVLQHFLLSYLTLNIIVILKSGLKVTQGHWKTALV